jgi:hypothetical protein
MTDDPDEFAKGVFKAGQARLAQDEERRRTGSEARGRGRLGQTEMAMIEAVTPWPTISLA